MQVHKVLQFVDEAVYLKTGRYLNDLQRQIIEGILQRQKYCDIAENYGCSEGHAKDVGYTLLQMLSKVFDEPVDKGNLKSVIERQGNQSIWGNIFGDSNIIGYINICSDQPNPKISKTQPANHNLHQDNLNKTNIELINKLRQFGLSDEQIAEALELPLEMIKQA